MDCLKQNNKKAVENSTAFSYANFALIKVDADLPSY